MHTDYEEAVTIEPVEERVEPLSHTSPVDSTNRPSKRCLIFTVLIATGLMLLGLFTGAVGVVVGWDFGQPRSAVVLMAIATLPLYWGTRSMIVAVQFLSGKIPRGEWETWIFKFSLSPF
jgi:hypothetical protein